MKHDNDNGLRFLPVCFPNAPYKWQIERREMQEQVLRKTNGACFYCGTQLSIGFHMDHFFPASRGGSDTLDNLVPSCANCNTSKGKMSIDEWRVYRAKQKIKKEKNMPTFTVAQELWLRRNGVDLYRDAELEQFWFERVSTTVAGAA